MTQITWNISSALVMDYLWVNSRFPQMDLDLALMESIYSQYSNSSLPVANHHPESLLCPEHWENIVKNRKKKEKVSKEALIQILKRNLIFSQVIWHLKELSKTLI